MIHDDIPSIVTYTDQITTLWKKTDDRDLASLLREILSLVDEAKTEGESLPLDLELDILLNANYALGFGGTPAEARVIADLYHRITEQSASHLSPNQIHRLGCTLASAVISILSSDEYAVESTAYDIISWEDLSDDASALDIIEILLGVLPLTLKLGEVSSWKLELVTFVITLQLIYQDLGGDQPLKQLGGSYINTFFATVDQSSDTWMKWKGSWLEKTDYYRFTTLMITSTSQPEETWIRAVESYL